MTSWMGKNVTQSRKVNVYFYYVLLHIPFVSNIAQIIMEQKEKLLTSFIKANVTKMFFLLYFVFSLELVQQLCLQMAAIIQSTLVGWAVNLFVLFTYGMYIRCSVPYIFSNVKVLETMQMFLEKFCILDLVLSIKSGGFLWKSAQLQCGFSLSCTIYSCSFPIKIAIYVLLSLS